MISSKVRFIALVASAAGVVVLAGRAGAQVSTGPGYIYTPLLTSDLTQSCVQTGPGGTFVGQGPGFTANGQRVVLASESGVESVVSTYCATASGSLMKSIRLVSPGGRS